MTKRFLQLGAFVFAAGLTAGLASAATSELMRVTLPYDVTVGKVTLHAGRYTISDLQTNGGANVLAIQAENGESTSVLFQRISRHSETQNESPQVILRRDGDKYEIDRIWLGGSDSGYELLSGQVSDK